MSIVSLRNIVFQRAIGHYRSTVLFDRKYIILPPDDDDFDDGNNKLYRDPEQYMGDRCLNNLSATSLGVQSSSGRENNIIAYTRDDKNIIFSYYECIERDGE